MTDLVIDIKKKILDPQLRGLLHDTLTSLGNEPIPRSLKKDIEKIPSSITVEITCLSPFLQRRVIDFLRVTTKGPYIEKFFIKGSESRGFKQGCVTVVDVKNEVEAQFIQLKLEDISRKFREEESKNDKYIAFKAAERSEEIKEMEQKIKGYRQFDESELALISEIDEIKSEVLRSIQKLEKHNSTDKVWVEAGKIDVEKAFMCLNRSIAWPTSV